MSPTTIYVPHRLSNPLCHICCRVFCHLDWIRERAISPQVEMHARLRAWHLDDIVARDYLTIALLNEDIGLLLMNVAAYCLVILVLGVQRKHPLASNTAVNIHLLSLEICLFALTFTGYADKNTDICSLWDLGTHKYDKRLILLPWGVPLIVLGAAIVKYGNENYSSGPILLRKNSGFLILYLQFTSYFGLHLLQGPSWSTFMLFLVALYLFVVPKFIQIIQS